jgi:DNA-binding CsgD family transcriptional regulator
MKNAGARAYIRELCSLGLASELLVPALLEALHRAIPSSRNLFDWVSSDGRIERYYFEGPIDHAIARRYFEEFHNKREVEAMPAYREVIQGPATIRSADELNHRGFFDSALYNEIWRPQHMHFRLEAIIRAPDEKPLGSLVLYRERGERIFDRADEDTLRLLVPYIAHGLQRATDRPIAYARSERRVAQVNLDDAGRIVNSSRDAHKLLLLAHGDISPRSASTPPNSGEFPTLARLHREVSREANPARSPFAMTLDNEWGRFQFRAERLEAASPEHASVIAVTIHHLVPRELRDLEAIEAQPLSITQKKVCALLLEGLSQPQIAARLRIAPSTAVDHVRKIYRKLDVHSLDALHARLREHPRA